MILHFLRVFCTKNQRRALSKTKQHRISHLLLFAASSPSSLHTMPQPKYVFNLPPVARPTLICPHLITICLQAAAYVLHIPAEPVVLRHFKANAISTCRRKISIGHVAASAVTLPWLSIPLPSHILLIHPHFVPSLPQHLSLPPTLGSAVLSLSLLS